MLDLGVNVEVQEQAVIVRGWYTHEGGCRVRVG